MSIELDEIDLKILRTLQEDADITIQHLAGRVGLSHTPCWRRYKRLVESRVILGKVVIIDPAAVGKDVTALCNVTLAHHDEESLGAFEQAVICFPEVIACYAMTGAKDYVLRVAVSSIAGYERFLKEKLLRAPNVSNVDTGFALKIVKLTSALPL